MKWEPTVKGKTVDFRKLRFIIYEENIGTYRIEETVVENNLNYVTGVTW